MITHSLSRFSTAIALLGAAVATPALANPSTNTSASERPAAAQRASGQRICVRETLTSSRMPRTICKTEAEWRAEGGVPGRD